MKKRIALAVEYDGSAYHGWQIQKKPAVPTVQARLETALGKVADQPVHTVCAGRTDTGVHASAQVVHFDTTVCRPLRAWVQGANTQLPDDISVLWATDPGQDFHARFSAIRRTYRYIILNRPTRSAVLSKKVTHVPRSLDITAMQQAGSYLLGERDFSAFRGAGCQSNSPFRNVDQITLHQSGDLIITEISANAFLLHMVRNIMGVLLAIGQGDQPPIWAKQVLESRDRRQAGITARPDGLYLVAVDYPSQFNLPILTKGPVFLP